MNIHPTAIIENGAVIGADCEIQAYAVIHKHARLGRHVRVFPHAVIGGDPQDLGFDPNTPSFVEIGDHCVLREHVTVHRATQPNKATLVGANSFLMASAHVAHDCVVEERVIMANAALLAGHVHVGERSFLGGGAAVHQFVRIGSGVMIGGLSRITLDCPPFTLVSERDELSGFNVVGLRRRGLSKSILNELKHYYSLIYRGLSDPRRTAALLLTESPPESSEAKLFLEFFLGGRRSVVRPRQPHHNSAD